MTLAGALSKVEGWLLEPPDPGERPRPGPVVGPRPVIAVFGLARGCGATTVARALAATLAGRDAGGAAAVSVPDGGGGPRLATSAAGRLARALEDVPRARARPSGRLALVEGAEPLALADTARHLAPLMLDAGNGPIGGVAAAVAERVVLVATPAVDPALAEVAAACLGRVGGEPLVALNRSPDPGPWAGRAAATLPESRLGAQLALSGREPRGELGSAVAELADRLGAER